MADVLTLAQEAAANAEPTTLEVAARIAVIVGAAATAGALIYAGRQVQLLQRQLKSDARHRRIDRTFNFVRRWNDPRFDKVRADVASFLRRQPSAQEIQDKREEDEEFRQNLSLVVNFLEELGVAWNRREINRNICFDFFGGVVLGWWGWLNSFVVEHRKGLVNRRRGLNPKVPKGVWAEFEKMHSHMESRAEDL